MPASGPVGAVGKYVVPLAEAANWGMIRSVLESFGAYFDLEQLNFINIEAGNRKSLDWPWFLLNLLLVCCKGSRLTLVVLVFFVLPIDWMTWYSASWQHRQSYKWEQNSILNMWKNVKIAILSEGRMRQEKTIETSGLCIGWWCRFYLGSRPVELNRKRRRRWIE